MGQHPVTQRTHTPAINLLAKRVRHHDRHADKSEDSGEPAQSQPRACKHRVKSIFAKCPEEHDGHENRYESAADVPCAREWIALVNVSAHRVSLIAKHKSLRWTNLAEVLDRIDTHERAGRTILFTRIRLAP